MPLPRCAEISFHLDVPHPGYAVCSLIEVYWRACTVGKFFEAHPGPHLLACKGPVSELRVRRCRLHDPPRGLDPCCFVELAEPAHGSPIPARFAPTTDLHFLSDARKRPGSWPAARSEAHRSARTAGEFFELHPGPPSA